MTLDNHLHNEIPRLMSLSSELELSIVINSSGKLYFLSGLNILDSLALARSARSGYYISLAMASLTLHSHHHNALLEGHETCPMAALTFLRFSARFGFASLASATSATFWIF